MAARSRAPARQTPLIQQSPLSPPSPPRSTAPSFGGGRLFGRSRDRDICYKCRGSGHWAQDCPNDQGSPSPARSPYLSGGSRFVRSRNQDICYACGIRGHWAQDCPNGSLDEIGQDHCFNCNLPGHWARDCSSIRSPNRRAQDICYECGLSGHWAEGQARRIGIPIAKALRAGIFTTSLYLRPALTLIPRLCAAQFASIPHADPL
ncbi:hypothetical protein B0H16DRAFT_490915 [Mycena metata]|uniref:CCHC-type domain-containing protein n=1 Tax=Mycena metata TaxID=1033252 RepID=A0AAD7JI94_9AGAR|nr:hypothetical protein B0H16DRAFT_490915 [Mycena metata]